MMILVLFLYTFYKSELSRLNIYEHMLIFSPIYFTKLFQIMRQLFCVKDFVMNLRKKKFLDQYGKVLKAWV